MAGATNARFTRGRSAGHDVVALRDGEVTIDARATAPVEIALGATGVRVAKAKVSVVARRGVIESVTVFAGSVQVSSGGKQLRVPAGTVWHRDTLAEPDREPAPSRDAASRGPADAAAAFRQGWEAIRAQRYQDAIAAFDRATDPVVAEDAAYWAAIAAERGGDRQAAIRRLTEFRARFPESPRDEAARMALEMLTR